MYRRVKYEISAFYYLHCLVCRVCTICLSLVTVMACDTRWSIDQDLGLEYVCFCSGCVHISVDARVSVCTSVDARVSVCMCAQVYVRAC